MQVKKHAESPTKLLITVTAEAKDLAPIKQHVLTHFQDQVKVPGFRSGKVPAEVLEKNIDPTRLQTEFLEEAVEQLYVASAKQLQVRPVDQPKISIKKFVPFTTLEFEATVEVLGPIKLPDYTKIKKTKPIAKVTDTDIKEVLESLRKRLAEKKDVTRAAKDGDELWIDFKGVDAKTKKPIQGAEGDNYPLVLGSKTFIPGFEEELTGQKAGSEKTFTLTFPKDYGAKVLAGQKVTFTVNVTKVQELSLPKLDDDFAAKVGPFKSLADLKADIRTQMQLEQQNKADREFESQLLQDISAKSTVAIPDVLVEDQIERLLQDLQQNLTYRGQTIAEFLETEGKTQEAYRKEVLKPQATERVKASLILAEVAEKEKLEVTPDELDARMESLIKEYKDDQMQAELAKPEARRDVAARLLTDKTITLLVSHATKKKA